MYYRKNLSIYESTFPFVWVCLVTWWLDRLFVELGHRAVDASLCLHNDLQYVQFHQYVCLTLVLFQMVKAVIARRREHVREAKLVNSSVFKCAIVSIFVAQTVLVVSWCIILSVLLDVSPWLCVPTLLTKRAVIALGALLCILATLPMEAMLWDYFLQRGLLNDV